MAKAGGQGSVPCDGVARREEGEDGEGVGQGLGSGCRGEEEVGSGGNVQFQGIGG